MWVWVWVWVWMWVWVSIWRPFEHLSGLIIIGNLVVLGLQANADESLLWTATDNVFQIWFMAELLLRALLHAQLLDEENNLVCGLFPRFPFHLATLRREWKSVIYDPVYAFDCFVVFVCGVDLWLLSKLS